MHEKNLHQCLSNKQLNISKFNAVIHASNNYMKFRACITKKKIKASKMHFYRIALYIQLKEENVMKYLYDISKLKLYNYTRRSLN